MIENILDTKVKIKIAKLFSEKEGALQVSDVARILGISKSRTSECLRELAEKGILDRKIIGRSVVYSLSSGNFAKAVSTALTQEKVLISKLERNAVSEIKKLKPASFVLFGSALKGLRIGSDVDFLLLYENDLKKEKIYEIVSKLSEEFGLRISILAISANEFKSKARRGEEFVLNILANNKLLYGKNLEDIVW